MRPLRAAAWACALLLAALPCAHAAVAVTLDQAVAVASDAARPSEVDFFSRGRRVTLPDNWRRTREGLQGVVWYALALDAPLQVAGRPEGGGNPVLVVPRLADGGDVWLNGGRLDIGAAGGLTRNRALWIELPAHELRPEGNVLHVRVSGSAQARGGLSQVTLGPAPALRLGYEVRRLLQTTVPQMLMFAVAICLAGAVPLWLKTRRPVDLMFAGLGLAWLPRALLVLSPTSGVPSQAGWVLAVASTLIANTLIVMMVLELSKWTDRLWKRYLHTLWAVAGMAFAASAALGLLGALRPAVVAALHVPMVLLMAVPVLAQIELSWRTRRPADIFAALTLLAWWWAVLHDLGVGLDRAAFDSFFWAPIAGLFMLLSLVWRTLQSLALQRGSAEREISKAVAHASSAHGMALEEMRAEFDRKKAEERQAVLAAERTRLLHDLHDGMGSQLITALRMVRRDNVPRDEVAKVIEDSLEDIRLIIDSLDLEERDLLPLLGNLRYRLEPRLNALGVALHWDVELLPELDYLSPETGLNIVRIVQEAVNNAVRHGAAGNITVRVRATGQAIELSISDDGCGFDVAGKAAAGSPKRGLGAMRARGHKLGGEVRVASGPAGTQVMLTLPLRR